MSDPLFQIHWHNTRDARVGIGPKLFPEAEARAVCDQLNEEFPHVQHTVRPAGTPIASPKPEGTTTAPARSLVPPGAVFRPLTDNSPFPFGIHKENGLAMWEVKADFYDWLRGQPQLLNSWPAVADYIERNQKSIDWELKKHGRWSDA